MQNQNTDWKYLAGCGVPVLIILCFCSLLCFCTFFFLASISQTAASLQDTTGIHERYLSGVDPLTDPSILNKDKIAVINVTGMITYSLAGSTLVETGATSNNIISQLQKAQNDESVQAVILRLNTPGGEVNAGRPICNQIQKVRELKPVFAFLDTSAASLGYYIANCTQYIYSREGSITGSIGVLAQATDLTGILENLGARIQTITNTRGTLKTGDDVFDKNSETYRQYQRILDETYEDFINIVTEGRNGKLTREEILKLADGRIFSGKQAASLKLVDELGEFDEVLARVLNNLELEFQNTEFVEYYYLGNPFGGLFPGIFSQLQNLNPQKILEDSRKVNILY